MHIGNKLYSKCARKVCFRSQQRAMNAAKQMGKRPGFKLEAYECNYCGGWHLGHKSETLLRKESVDVQP